MRHPFFFCCSGRWCRLDTALHFLGITWQWVCDKHDNAITRHEGIES